MPKGHLHGFPEALESPEQGLSGGEAWEPSVGHPEASLGDGAELGRGFPGAGPSRGTEQA